MQKSALPGMADSGKHDRWKAATPEERGSALEALSATALINSSTATIPACSDALRNDLRIMRTAAVRWALTQP